MASVTFVGTLVLGLLVAAGPTTALTSSDHLDPAFDQGLAHSGNDWVVSGRNVLARLDNRLQVELRIDDAIPEAWRARGFDHIGDVDVAGTTLYVPFEQADYARGRQAMARYDADTLEFRDATFVDQHENSFVAVDGATGIAYSMDRFGGDALLRYDVRAGWRQITPLRINRALERVQGAAVARDAVWLSTDDAHHGMYRVDLETGEVADIGSAPPPGGEGEGIDATKVGVDTLHATVVAPDRSEVLLDHFRLSGDVSDSGSTSAKTDTSWPPALVYFAIALLVVALAAVGTVFYRARTTIHPKR